MSYAGSEGKTLCGTPETWGQSVHTGHVQSDPHCVTTVSVQPQRHRPPVCQCHRGQGHDTCVVWLTGWLALCHRGSGKFTHTHVHALFLYTYSHLFFTLHSFCLDNIAFAIIDKGNFVIIFL